MFMTRVPVSALVIFLLACPLAVADDENPLNLPAPQRGGKLGAVMLHGGGPLSDEIFERFIELAGGKDARIVLIPSGTYVQGRKANKEFDESREAFEARLGNRYGSWVDLARERRIASFQFLYSDNQDDADNPDFVKPLLDATGVWIPAAYQGKLNWRFAAHYPDHLSRVQRALRDVVARGGVVGGQGGGAVALPEVMIMGDTGQQDGPAEAIVRYGLGLFHGAIVDQQFDARGGRLERFTGLLRNSQSIAQRLSWPATARNLIGLAVEPSTALIVCGNAITAIGEGRGHIFTKSNGDRTITWRILAPTDDAVLITSAFAASRWSSAQESRANDRRPWPNPFGIPEPRDAAKPGTVVLHGGGGNSDLIPIIPDLARVPKPALVHCPAASES